jgi:RHS repeat-associated protein
LYGYDADGQRTGMTDGTGSWSWTYDDLHRITSVAEGDNGVVSYQYDRRGSLTSITYPDENSVVHGYDAAGRWTSVTDWLGNKTTFGYDPSGDLTTETLPAGTGLVDTFGYNDAGQMSASAVNQGASALLAADYGRDSDGLVSSDTAQPASSQFYGYTPLNQLCSTAASAGGTCATPPAGATSYAYDAANDPTTDAGTAQVFNNDDQLCWTASGTSSGSCASPPSGATVYTYNSSGERTTVTPAGTSPTTMGYDQAGSLTSLTGPAASATYTYNGDGLLATEKVGKKTTRDTWDLSGSMPVLMAAGSAYYVDGPDGLPLEQITGSTVLWLHHDQLGSTRLVTNATGTAVAGYTYGATGTLTSSTGTASATQLRYTGQYLDPASGLYDMRARDYDPATDQFITADPLASLTRQPYEYADDDPLNDVDPTGLGYCPDGVGIPFTDLCLDNPLDLSQDVQNFDQNSAALDNTPLGGFLENFDPFYGDIRDVIYWVQGCQVNVESDLANTASAFAPGPSDVEGVLHEGGQAAFAGRLAQVTNYKVGSVLYDNRQVVDDLTEAGAESGLGAAPFLPSSGSGCSCGM